MSEKVELYQIRFANIEEMQSEDNYCCFTADLALVFVISKDGKRDFENMFEVDCTVIDQGGKVFMSSGTPRREVPPFTPSFVGYICSEHGKSLAKEISRDVYRSIAAMNYKSGLLATLYFAGQNKLAEGFTIGKDQAAHKFVSTD